MSNHPEYKLQVSMCKWLRAVLPRALIQHSVNEVMKRGKAGMLTAQRNKAAGVMTGFPDLTIALDNGKTLYVEVKTPKGRVSPAQKQVHDLLRNRGHAVAVCRSIDDLRDFLSSEGIQTNEVTNV